MKWHSCIVAALFAALLPAQHPAPSGGVKPKPTKKTSRVDERARSMRDQITEGRVVKSHVRVRVRLQNGNRLTGVVKDGRLVERVDGLRFVDAQAKERGAGIRLWYTGGTRSYIFVPFDSLKTYEVVQRLSQQQLQQIEKELQMAEKRAAERAARKAAAKAATKPAAGAGAPAQGAQPQAATRTPPPTVESLGDWKPQQPGSVAPSTSTAEGVEGGATKGATTRATKGEAGSAPDQDGAPVAGPTEAKAAEAKAAEVAQQLRWSELLRKFPPKAGWNKAKKNEISRRLIVVGAKPSKLEQEFVDSFDDWVKACRHNGVDPDAAVQKRPQSRGERRRAERARRRGGRN